MNMPKYVDRRSFLQGLGGLGAMAALSGCRSPFAFGGGKPLIGLQLYSIHSIFWQSPEVILEDISRAGYDGVEFYDYNGRSGEGIRRLCKDSGLIPFGTHLNGDISLVGDELKRTLDFAAAAGFQSLVTPHAKRATADEYRRFGFAMGVAAEAAAEYGIQVGVHCTYHHFKTTFDGENALDGLTAWDMIFSEASPRLYQQIDTANVVHTGYNLIDLLKQYEGRHFSIHMKENVPTIDGVYGVPPRDGGPIVPWADVVAQMKREDGNEWWIVEAEGKPDSLEPAKSCCRILRGWRN